jgi:hypothetical protein
MFNFKKFNYDSIDEHFKVTEKKITRLKLDNEVMKHDYYFVSEYIAPRINAVLPKDYRVSLEYYLMKGSVDNYVQFNQEYYQHFKDNFWTFEHIWDTLHDPALANSYTLDDTSKLKNMPGFGWANLPYFLIIGAIIFSLFYNTVSKPWSVEIQGNPSQTVISKDVGDYKNNVSYIDYKGTQLLKLNRTEQGNWQKLQADVSISYELCSQEDTSTFLVVTNNKISKNVSECEGKGVITPLLYPDVQFITQEFIPDNIIARDNLGPTAALSLENGIKFNTKELGIKEPNFMIYRDYKVVSTNDLKLRSFVLVFASLLPILFALYSILRQYNFRKTLELNKLTK